ncbi:hypothetical protein GQ44DRAFT_761043 [Phaeosphaeriaceae sp. PMI808]|nr:hypothetical protein GQ44DRAFT_761043 [Phaeosphaeriaceae sp. PMI808]
MSLITPGLGKMNYRHFTIPSQVLHVSGERRFDARQHFTCTVAQKLSDVILSLIKSGEDVLVSTRDGNCCDVRIVMKNMGYIQPDGSLKATHRYKSVSSTENKFITTRLQSTKLCQSNTSTPPCVSPTSPSSPLGTLHIHFPTPIPTTTNPPPSALASPLVVRQALPSGAPTGPRPTNFPIPTGGFPSGFPSGFPLPTGPRPTGPRPTGPRPTGPRPTGPRPTGAFPGRPSGAPMPKPSSV